MSDLEPTLQEAIRGMVERAVADGYFTGDGNRVMLSLDLLTQLGCVPEGVEERIDAELARHAEIRKNVDN